MISQFEHWVAGGQPPRIAESVGMKMTACGDGRAVIEFHAGPPHENPMGTVHGGVLSYVADTAMGFAWASGLVDGETFAAVELKINFFRPVVSGKVTAEAEVLRRGRTLGYVECSLADAAGKLVAKSSGTFMTSRGGGAAQRSLYPGAPLTGE